MTIIRTIFFLFLCMMLVVQITIFVLDQRRREGGKSQLGRGVSEQEDTVSKKGVMLDLLLETLVFIQRRERMNKMCQTYAQLHKTSLGGEGELDHILVDERHKLLYCYVPKVACTNWKRVFMILVNASDATNASSIPSDLVHKKGILPKLSDYGARHAAHFIANFTKIVFVRHPFERLLSAYKNKLQEQSPRSKYFQQRVGREIVKRYRMNASKEAVEAGADVSFPEFASYLVDTPIDAFNEHWKPISDLCLPCLIKYDFIGKYETLYPDSEFLLKAIGESQIKFPKVKSSNSTCRIRNYFQSLPDRVVARLYDIFVLDFKLFDYNTADILGYEIG